ncbi:hypothetical protein ACHQM5_024931 [Ranunculus cassubicifolius]
MGRKGNKGNSRYEDDDECSSSMSNLKLKPNTTKALEGYLELLFQKRGPTKEKALSLIADSFKNNIQHRFVSNKCITLLHRCLSSIKLGPTKESCLASHVIGLLSITVGCTDGLAHEILEDAIPVLSQSLQSSSEPIKIASLLDCMAIVTFVGANNAEETERSMQVIWQFLYSKPGPRVRGQTPQALTAAISSWSFLLATMDSWSINSKLWKESIPYFSNLLSTDDLSLHMAVGEALALIFEIGNPAKFFDETTEESEGQEGLSIEGLKGTILNQIGILSVDIESNESVEKGLIKRYRTLLDDVSRVLKGGYIPEPCIRIGGDVLKISTWSHLVQVNYLKRFLGAGFVKHAKENELLHDFLEFTPKRNSKNLLGQHMINDEKETTRYLYQREVKQGAGLAQKMLYSENSVINKAKTQLRNKKRVSSQAKNDGHFAVTFANDDT